MRVIRFKKLGIVYIGITCGVFLLTLLLTSSDNQQLQSHDGVNSYKERNTLRHKSFDDGLVVRIWPPDSDVNSKAKRNPKNSGVKAKKKWIPGNIEKEWPISEEVVPCSPRNFECRRFRTLLESWPADKPKAAFYLLTQAKRLHYIKTVLASIDTNFNNKYEYPIIIFHEEDLIPLIPTIRSITSSYIFFQMINFSIPDFIDPSKLENISCYAALGYRHMCRFHAKGVFQQPIMRGLDYYWRLDDDSIILKPVEYDVFDFMREKDLIYGYSWRHLDSSLCTIGLWNATRTFINKTDIQPTYFHEWPEPYMFYNNFEISELKLWLSRKYADYIDYLDKLGGIYYHRWGDAPIKSLALSLFIPRSKLHKFQDIGYQHRSYINKGDNIP